MNSDDDVSPLKRGVFLSIFSWEDLSFMRSTQGRCPGQTPDQPFRYPWGLSPPWAAWPQFESYTQSLSCPTVHLISEEKESINQCVF